ncbi:FKBP-type peptidyl-prolyl cis-trans isomerase [Rubrivirga marina]|uniref:Peptidyl-prolyl cis-trans isomerase n=1 Tax=Rubrivirga marina TaxID=1196024 RepID=A0A271IWR9_9BACT|nr:FKBP-type peptidyl-prolyl cis-trans isomerase [Rubrivirga marina]PAP75632.1 hypothetical protein BSZ37_03865 [Rubrivirga marina]
MHRLALLSLLVLAVAACDSSPSVVEDGVTVLVAYEGRLDNGDVFDSSAGAEFVVREAAPGQPGLISGFYDGLLGMMIGESKTLVIPPEQAYGAGGVVNPNTGEVIIPPNATLTFDVTILDIR